MSGSEDLYEVLGISRAATRSEIKKAYHKAALASHPDKVPEEEREEAEIRFKIVSQAYEILSDDEKKQAYDDFGMDAFSPGGRGPSGHGMNEEEFFNEFFGFGGHGMGGRARPSKDRSQATADAVQQLDVTLKALYKGKTTKMSIKRNVVCSHCKGSGARSNAKAHKCSKCDGHGVVEGLRPIGNGLAIPYSTKCTICNGRGEILKEKDKCKKCKGNRVIEQSKILEIYIAPGSKNGDRIILEGEADQEPGKKTGNIVFALHELPDPFFQRKGSDLRAKVQISLAEALCGFSRCLLEHLDGRVIRVTIPAGKVIRPNDILIIKNEGMPVKGGGGAHNRGDLYLDVEIEFPKDNWFLEVSELRKVSDSLPSPRMNDIKGDIEDEAEVVISKSDEKYGADDIGDNDAEWQSETDQTDGCTQQ
ncbi:hypothetical protein V1511DRAFT_499743 [Dipodascopsis uninucleata]